jgi:hypothetical protein
MTSLHMPPNLHSQESNISMARAQRKAKIIVFTVPDHVVDQPVVIIHTILVDPPNSTCMHRLPKKKKDTSL